MRSRVLLKKICRYLTDKDYRFLIHARLGKYDSMPDEEYLKRKFKVCIGKELDLEEPRTFNEKLQWLKLYDRKPEYTQMVDKYRAREYIAQTIGEEYLIPLLGAWDDPEDIDFDALPDQFVLKCNHNSGTGMCICKDKPKLDIEKVRKDLRKGLAQDYYLTGREWPYKNVPRKIIAEKFMVDESGVELKDYKVFCFDGEPKAIQVDFDRFTEHKRNVYSTQWELLEVGIEYPRDPSRIIEKPKKLEEMLRLAQKLSAGIPHVRVDFYIIEDKIYFGELTFYHGSGYERFVPEEWGHVFGGWIKLPKQGRN